MASDAAFRRPHPFWDRSIRFLLQHPEHAKTIVTFCHPELAEQLDFGRLEWLKRSFIDEEYRQREADLVLRVPYRDVAGDREVIVYLLLEHQSGVDVWMPFRLARYMISLWNDLHHQRGGEPRLPPVIPIVFYTGREPWKASLDFRDLIDGPP
ncbi:MAG TPA: Rpn family recombination-promoting nuclease/putative transposase, partial [Phycisphaerae bacterium]